MKSCPVSAHSCDYDALLKLMQSGVLPACEAEAAKTLELIRAVASFKKATSPKGRAFHRFCIEVATDGLGDGVIDPREQRDLADAVLRTTGLTETLRVRAMVEGLLAA